MNIAPRKKASSLVTTLLVLVVLSAIVVAFLQSMAVERTTAKSYSNQYRAELAAEAGRDVAINAIVKATGRDDFIVLRSGNYTYIGNTVSADSDSISYTPLFTQTTNMAQLLSTSIAGTNALPNVTPAGQYPASLASMSPFYDTSRTVTSSLVGITNSSNRVSMRFAYWIEDLNGRVDAAVAGNLANGGRHTRPTGTNASEVALFTLFSSNAAADPGDVNSKNIIERRDLLISPKTYLQVVSSVPDEIKDEITFNLPQTLERSVIPSGFGYSDAGKPKYNLNFYTSKNDVAALASKIGTNLPNFAARKGGLPDDYNKTLAANIIDYVDTNSISTIGADYRGVDSMPFVTILHDWAILDSITQAGGRHYANVRASAFIQIWNPSDKDIRGIFKFEFKNNDDLVAGANRVYMDNPTFMVSGFPYSDKTVSLAPNEITILEFGPITYRFDMGPVLPGGEGVPTSPLTRNSSTHNRTTFKTYWDGVLVDSSRGGMERVNGTLATGAAKVIGGLPGLRHLDYKTTAADQPSGDPRAFYYLNSTVAQQSYPDRTGWWGMAIMRPMPGRYMTDPRQWTDPAPYTAQSYPATNSGTSLTVNLTLSLLNGYKSMASLTKTNEAPFIFNNTGTFNSATELGNVYDPALWSYAPTNGIPTNASAAANSGGGFGGGFSLRIGRPEHPKFSERGKMAAQLLDIFGVSTNFTDETLTAALEGGKININTAGTNALRALIAGIQLQRDASSVSWNIPTNGTAIGKWFADAVIAERAKRPFLSVSELTAVKNSLGAVLGNRDQWTSGQPPATFKDVALEEMFAKIYDLATVKSRNFRIVVVGQALNEQGKVVGTARKDYYISLNPERDTNGTITNQIYRSLYEVSF